METQEGPSDAELLVRVRSGDLEAYGELFGRHHHAAERMARQLVPPSDADDLASEAFAKVLSSTWPTWPGTVAAGPPSVSARTFAAA